MAVASLLAHRPSSHADTTMSLSTPPHTPSSSWRTGSLSCACKLMSSDTSPFLRHMLTTLHSFALPVECADFSAAFEAYCYCCVMEYELLDKSDCRILLHTVA